MDRNAIVVCQFIISEEELRITFKFIFHFIKPSRLISHKYLQNFGISQDIYAHIYPFFRKKISQYSSYAFRNVLSFVCSKLILFHI